MIVPVYQSYGQAEVQIHDYAFLSKLWTGESLQCFS